MQRGRGDLMRRVQAAFPAASGRVYEMRQALSRVIRPHHSATQVWLLGRQYSVASLGARCDCAARRGGRAHRCPRNPRQRTRNSPPTFCPYCGSRIAKASPRSRHPSSQAMRVWLATHMCARGSPPRSRVHACFRARHAGWGCMLRTGQMMLAQACRRHLLGRRWRLAADGSPTSAQQRAYLSVCGPATPQCGCPHSLDSCARRSSAGSWTPRARNTGSLCIA